MVHWRLNKPRTAFIPPTTISVLGNHDLTLFCAYYGFTYPTVQETYQEILQAHDALELISWLLHRPFLHYDANLNYVMSHACIYPLWDLNTAISCAREAESALQQSRR